MSKKSQKKSTPVTRNNSGLDKMAIFSVITQTIGTAFIFTSLFMVWLSLTIENTTYSIIPILLILEETPNGTSIKITQNVTIPQMTGFYATFGNGLAILFMGILASTVTLFIVTLLQPFMKLTRYESLVDYLGFGCISLCVGASLGLYYFFTGQNLWSPVYFGRGFWFLIAGVCFWLGSEIYQIWHPIKME